MRFANACFASRSGWSDSKLAFPNSRRPTRPGSTPRTALYTHNVIPRNVSSCVVFACGLSCG
jgi:hypothetical protein